MNNNYRMNLEEAIETLEQCIGQQRLSKIQKIIFQESRKGCSYVEIANNYSYDIGYVTDTGSKLWQLLSEAFREKVTKRNFQLILEEDRQNLCESKSRPAV